MRNEKRVANIEKAKSRCDIFMEGTEGNLSTGLDGVPHIAWPTVGEKDMAKAGE